MEPAAERFRGLLVAHPLGSGGGLGTELEAVVVREEWREVGGPAPQSKWARPVGEGRVRAGPSPAVSVSPGYAPVGSPFSPSVRVSLICTFYLSITVEVLCFKPP